MDIILSLLSDSLIDLINIIFFLNHQFVYYLRSYELAPLQISKHFFHLVDQSSISCQVLDLFVRYYELTDSLGQVQQKGRVSDVVPGDRTSITFHFF